MLVLPIWYLVSRWGSGPQVYMHHFRCGMNWINGYYMIVKVKNENFWFSTYSMEMHSLTSSSFITCLWGEMVWFENFFDELLGKLLPNVWLSFAQRWVKLTKQFILLIFDPTLGKCWQILTNTICSACGIDYGNFISHDMFDYRNRYFVEVVTETIWQDLYFLHAVQRLA